MSRSWSRTPRGSWRVGRARASHARALLPLAGFSGCGSTARFRFDQDTPTVSGGGNALREPPVALDPLLGRTASVLGFRSDGSTRLGPGCSVRDGVDLLPEVV